MIHCHICKKVLGERGEAGRHYKCRECVERQRAYRETKKARKRYVSENRLCRHCQRRRVNRPLGLCWTCYYTPGVRALYPSESKFCTHTAREVWSPEPAGLGHALPCPTKAPPGSPEKVLVLEERARLGQALWHPLDARTRLE